MSEQPSITLAETKQAKTDLENAIRDALRQFTAKTTLLVTDVNVQSMIISRDDMRVSGLNYKVEVETKLL